MRGCDFLGNGWVRYMLHHLRKLFCYIPITLNYFQVMRHRQNQEERDSGRTITTGDRCIEQSLLFL
jgi:hypothetical protein